MINLLLAGLCIMGLQATPEEIIAEDKSPSMSYVCEFNQKEIELMVRVTMSEASTQTMECKEAVATTILNRYYSPKFSGDIATIIDGQFSTQDNGVPNDDCYTAVSNAIKYWGTPDQVIPWCCYYFRGYYFHEWAQDYRKIDNLYFSLPRDAVID